MDFDDAMRFLDSFDRGDRTECWPWRRNLADGYGRFFLDGRYQMAHRVGYEWLRAPIPEGLELDHLCRNRACVNPMHLEPVTRKVNVQRGWDAGRVAAGPVGIPGARVGGAAVNAAKERCPAGHLYLGANLYVDKIGRRYCRECRKLRRRKK